MAQLKRKPKDIECIDENAFIDSNKEVLKSNSKDQLTKAKAVLEKAKQNELNKKGFVWIVKEKTSKLVSPCKLKNYLLEGWKKMKIK